jgi:hypothetical protein
MDRLDKTIEKPELIRARRKPLSRLHLQVISIVGDINVMGTPAFLLAGESRMGDEPFSVLELYGRVESLAPIRSSRVTRPPSNIR